MKKNLLIAFLFTTSCLSAQTWTSADEVSPGDSSLYYLMDSTLDNQAGKIGSAQVWNYVSASTYSYDELALTRASDASFSLYSNFFPNATHDEYYDQTVHVFYSLSTSARTWYGMQIHDDKQGDLIVKFDSFPDRTYPMTVGSSLSHTFSNAEVIIYPNNASKEKRFPATGDFMSTCDGSGTLIIGDSSFSDVLRYYRRDSIITDLGILGKARLVRKQFEYLKSGRDFPLFIFTELKVKGALPLTIAYVQVLSQVKPKISLGMPVFLKSDDQLSVGPNPTSDLIRFTLPEGKLANSISVYDQTGKTIPLDWHGGLSIDVRTLPEGLYFLRVNMEDGSSGLTRFIKSGN